MAVAVWKQNTISGVGQKGDPGEMDYSIVAESEGTPDYKMIDGKLYKLVDSNYEETKIMNEVAQKGIINSYKSATGAVTGTASSTSKSFTIFRNLLPGEYLILGNIGVSVNTSSPIVVHILKNNSPCSKDFRGIGQYGGGMTIFALVDAVKSDVFGISIYDNIAGVYSYSLFAIRLS